jgi:hypothetical protein
MYVNIDPIDLYLALSDIIIASVGFGCIICSINILDLQRPSIPPHLRQYIKRPQSARWMNDRLIYVTQAKYEELELRVTSMTRKYLDPRSRPQALATILADLKSMDESSSSSSSDDIGFDESLSYAQNLKRSVVLESWAASDYDPRHHRAYCEVSYAA